MAITRRYLCPDCGYEFSFLHMSRDEPPPSYCSGCGTDMRGDDNEVPSAPAIIGVKAKAVDAAYNDAVAASQVRAAAAGDPSIVITDMKDNLKAGDVAFKGPQPSQEYVKTVADMAPDFTPWQANVQSHIASAHTGPGAKDGGGRVAMRAIQGGRGGTPTAASSIKGSWGGGAS